MTAYARSAPSSRFGNRGRRAKNAKAARKTIRQNARAIARLNERTGGFEGLEVKFHDTAVIDAQPGNNGDMTGGKIDPTSTLCLNAMSQGVDEKQRLGRTISMRAISVKGRVHLKKSEGDTSPQGAHQIMLVLVMDKQTNASSMTSDLVFSNPSGDVGGINSVFRNMEHTDRFTVLATRHIVLQPEVTQFAINDYSNAGNLQLFSMYVPLRNKKVLYTGSTGTIAAIQDNSIHMLAFANGIVVDITYNARLTFTTT